nr:immunoglobulin light chain junction region [Macaca mulatta]
CLQHDNPPYTF